MSLSTLATLVGAHAKSAAAVLAVSAATGGGLAVATTVADSHAAPGLAIANAPPSASSSADSVESTDTTSTTDSPTATNASPATSTTPVTCDNAKNHGAYVSSIAHATPTPSGTASPEPNAHGKAVSEAAKSSCGKPATASGSDDSTHATDSTDASDSTESDATDSDGADDAGKPTARPSHPAHPKHSGHKPGH
jgi:hypothetical protein